MNENDTINAQISRIKLKLDQARRVDSNYRVFGASTHKYVIGEKISREDITEFETEFGVNLPHDYVAFFLQIGDCGKTDQDDAAGPYYGIFPFGCRLDMLVDADGLSLHTPPSIFPEMSIDNWQILINPKKLDDGNMTNEQLSRKYNKAQGKLYSGLLPICHQGCGIYTCLILSGKNYGKVVTVDVDDSFPFFAHENNFLDWYERWVDEVISGQLFVKGYSFGSVISGDEKFLLKSFNNATNDMKKIVSLRGITKVEALRPESITKLLNICETESSNVKAVATTVLAKYAPDKAIPHLQSCIHSTDKHCRMALQSVYWSSKGSLKLLASDVKERVGTLESPEAYKIAVNILDEFGADYHSRIVKNCSHHDTTIRGRTLQSLAKSPKKLEFIEYFIKGLSDPRGYVSGAAFKALSGVKDVRLIEPYYQRAERFQNSKGVVRSDLEKQLQELGFKSIEDFQAAYRSGTARDSFTPSPIKGGVIKRILNKVFGR